MRLSDHPSVEVDVHVDATAPAVWDLVTDVNLPARFSSEFRGAEWLDDETPDLGSRFRGHNQRGERTWSTTCTVTEFEPDSVFTWTVEDLENPVAIWSFRLAPEGDGTRLSMRAQLGPARSGFSRAVEAEPEREEEIVADRLDAWRRNMLATVEGVRDVAEGH